MGIGKMISVLFYLQWPLNHYFLLLMLFQTWRSASIFKNLGEISSSFMKGCWSSKESANFPLIDKENKNQKQRKLYVIRLQSYKDNFPEILWDANDKDFENQ